MQIEKQTVKTLIRLLVMEQSDLGLHCLPRPNCPKNVGSLRYIEKPTINILHCEGADFIKHVLISCKSTTNASHLQGYRVGKIEERERERTYKQTNKTRQAKYGNFPNFSDTLKLSVIIWKQVLRILSWIIVNQLILWSIFIFGI